MAIINALKTGDWSDITVLNPTPGPDDDVHANGYTVTIDEVAGDIVVASLNTTAGGGGSAGGLFSVARTCHITAALNAGTTRCLTSSGGDLTLTGNLTGGSGANAFGVYASGASQTITLTGNLTGGSGGFAYGVYASGASQTITITGNLTGGSGAHAYWGLFAGTSQTITITGNPTGGSGINASGVYAIGASQTITITGNPTGGSGSGASGVYATGASQILTITGNPIGGSGSGAYGVRLSHALATDRIIGQATASSTVLGSYGIYILGCATSTITVDDVIGSTAIGGIGLYNADADPVYVKALSFRAGSQSPIFGAVKFIPTADYNILVNTASGVARYLPEPVQLGLPSVGDVRHGTVFAGGTYTGTAYIPGATSVAAGVPVDATVGVAVITEDAQIFQDILTALGSVDAIKLKTDNLPADPASETSLSVIIEDIYDLTHNSEGEVVPVVIPPPASSDSCTIYALCYNHIGNTPLTSVTAVAKIISLPYYTSGKYHEGESVAGTYASGVCSWGIVQGAEVSVSIKEIGLMGRGIVPASESADVYTFLEV